MAIVPGRWPRFGLLVLLTAPLPTPASDAVAGLEYTLEYRRNLDGGLAVGAAWLDQLVLFAGVEDRWYASALVTNGNTFSDVYVGDAQTVSNIDTDDTQRLYEAWYQWRLGDSQLLAGLFDLNSEFDAIGVAGVFNNSSHGIGPDFSQSGQRGPSIFPHAAFALRLAGGDEVIKWRVAAFDAVPGSINDERASSVQLHSDEGVLLVGELEWNADWRYAIGTWLYSESFQRLDGVGVDRQRGTYAFAEGPFADTRAGAISAFVRVGSADSGSLPVQSYLGAGIVLQASDTTQFGVALARAGFSSAQRELIAADGVAASGELVLELTCNWQALPWLALQPDLQWVRRPGGYADVANAKVVGLRVVVSL